MVSGFSVDDMIIGGITLFIIVLAIIILQYVSKRIAGKTRLKMIRAYKAAPVKNEGSPVLIHGTVGAKGVMMPSGGEAVAFHATFIMSRGCTLFVQSGLQKALPEPSSFRIFVTSGDFTVTESGIPYTVSIISALERMNMGAGYFTKKHRTNAILDGIPETVFDSMVRFIAGSQALGPVFAISETGRSLTSSVDSRVRTFRQGTDVPPGIAEVLKGKIIRPQPGEEITVAEFYIPLKKDVWVFGEFDGKDTIRYGEKGAGLHISYMDPELEEIQP